MPHKDISTTLGHFSQRERPMTQRKGRTQAFLSYKPHTKDLGSSIPKSEVVSGYVWCKRMWVCVGESRERCSEESVV